MSESSETLKSMLIGGEWIAQGEAAFASVNPATGAHNYLVSAASDAQVDQAVEAAWQAQRQPAGAFADD
jgi:betaine-aldehyde dehydrogenase